MYFNADIVNISGSQAKPSAKLLQGNAPLLPFPLGAEGSCGASRSQACSAALPPAAPQGPTPKPLGLRGLWRWRQQGQGHWAWGQQEGDEEGRCRHLHWRGSGCPSLGGKDPFWVPTTHLLFSFTNLVIKKKNISPFLNF